MAPPVATRVSGNDIAPPVALGAANTNAAAGSAKTSDITLAKILLIASISHLSLSFFIALSASVRPNAARRREPLPVQIHNSSSK
jgi:hypothetical protein